MRNSPQVRRRSYQKKLTEAEAIHKFNHTLGVELDSSFMSYVFALRLMEASRCDGVPMTRTIAKCLRNIISKYEKTGELKGATNDH